MEIGTYGKLWEKFLAGELDSEGMKCLEKVLGENPDGELDSYFSSMWSEAGSADSKKAGRARSARMKDKILGRIAVAEDADRRYMRRRRAASYAAAAFAAAALLLAAGVAHVFRTTRNTLEYEVVAERGQKSSVTLPDGSRVWLNSASRITYTSGFNKDNRDITLEGEAYFEVAKNRKIPFIVHASGMSVCAVGTEFNVRNYADENEVRTTLVEGCVVASAAGFSTSLNFAQEAVLDKTSGLMTSGDSADPDHLVPWRNNEILLDNDSLGTLARRLSRMYNMDVIFIDKEIREYSYTGLIRNNSLQNVLELISGSSPVDYEISGDNILFKKR